MNAVYIILTKGTNFYHEALLVLDAHPLTVGYLCSHVEENESK